MVQCGLVLLEICRALWRPGGRRCVKLDHTLDSNMVLEVGPRGLLGRFGSGVRKPERRAVEHFELVLQEGILPCPLGSELSNMMVFLFRDKGRSGLKANPDGEERKANSVMFWGRVAAA